jgi:hypothetical protein
MGLLWFRRSKAKETEEVAPHPAPAAPGPARVRLRLRGLLLLNLKPSDGPEHIEKAPPLGGRDEVIVALQALAPGITFDAEGRAEYRRDNYRLSIDLGRGDPVPAAVAGAEGDTAVDLLRLLMERQGWRAYVPKAGVFVEPDALDLFGLSE